MRTIDVVLEELVEKSRKNSNGKELLWSIVSSLRGADVDVDDVDGNVSLSTCDEFKQLTTARVRGILGLVNLFLDINQIPLSDEQIVRRTELLNVLDEKTKWSTDHFCNHFKHAMRSLKTLGYDVPDKELDF